MRNQLLSVVILIPSLVFATQSAEELVYSSADNNKQMINIEYIDGLLEYSETIRTKDFPKFISNLKLLEKLEEQFSRSQKCNYDYLSAFKNLYSGYSTKGINQLNRIFDSCINLNIKVKAKILLANFFANEKDYYNSIDSLNYVVSQIDSITNKDLKHYAYAVSSLVYELLGINDLSIKFANLLLNDNPSDTNICKANYTKYSIIIKSNYDPSLDNVIQEAIEICNTVNENIYSNAIKLYWYQEKLKLSNDFQLNLMKDNLNASKEEIINTRYNNLITASNGILAQIYWRLGQKKLAVQHAETAINESNSLKGILQKFEYLQLLIDYYNSHNQHKKAYDYLEMKSNAEKIFYDDNQAKLMAYQTVSHENLAKTHQIEYLNKQNEVLKLSNDLSQKEKLNQRLVILSLTLTAAFLLFWGYRHRREQQIYRKLSELDHMTLIYNRKGLRDYMDYMLPYSKKKQEIIAYGIFDLDHFKNVNDQYGHITGDWVIKNVILACQKVRDDNEKITFGRLGGEEFAIIIRDSNIQELKEFAEKCRQQIERIDTKESGFDFQITASFGLTTNIESGFVYTDLMTNADKALYKAKEQGRNQVVIYKELDFHLVKST